MSESGSTGTSSTALDSRQVFYPGFESDSVDIPVDSYSIASYNTGSSSSRSTYPQTSYNDDSSSSTNTYERTATPIGGGDVNSLVMSINHHNTELYFKFQSFLSSEIDKRIDAERQLSETITNQNNERLQYERTFSEKVSTQLIKVNEISGRVDNYESNRDNLESSVSTFHKKVSKARNIVLTSLVAAVSSVVGAIWLGYTNLESKIITNQENVSMLKTELNDKHNRTLSSLAVQNEHIGSLNASVSVLMDRKKDYDNLIPKVATNSSDVANIRERLNLGETVSVQVKK